jgi:hypothetical protein
VRSDGSTLRQPFHDYELPVSDEVRGLTSRSLPGDAVFSDTKVAGTHVRVLAFAYGPGYAVQVARPLTEVDDALRKIGLFLVLVALSGIGIAAAFGLVVSRAHGDGGDRHRDG